MFKNYKVLISIIIITVLCTNITYGAVSENTANTLETTPPVQVPSLTIPPPDPLPLPLPLANMLPDPEPVLTAPYVTLKNIKVPAAEKEQHTEDKQAALFQKEIGNIVMKRLTYYFKKGGGGTIGIYIKELNSNFEYAYNAEKTNPDNPEEGYFNSASTCKLFSAAVMYHMDYKDELDLGNTFTDTVTKSKYKLKNILPKMISHSVNDYFNITLRHLGSNKINEELKELGVKHSLVYSEIMPAQYSSITNNIKRYGISRSPRTTPKDLAHILELLYREKTFSPENNKLFSESLKNNIYSNRLPAGIGYRSAVAHKTGTSAGEGVYNDAGIIYLKDNPYIMVVMSKKSGSNVQSLFRIIARDVYDAMKKRAAAQPSMPK